MDCNAIQKWEIQEPQVLGGNRKELKATMRVSRTWGEAPKRFSSPQDKKGYVCLKR